MNNALQQPASSRFRDAGLRARSTGADQDDHALLGRMDPANALVELSKDFTTKTGHSNEIRVRTVAEFLRTGS